MTNHSRFSRPAAPRRAWLPALVTASAALLLAFPAHAERADRLKRPVIESDAGGQFDLQKQALVIEGNVVITQGTMVIRAARVEVRELPSGYYAAVAFGSPSKPATFRQKRDGVDEYVEGQADRLEYDGKSDVVRFINNAELHRLRGATLADEAKANLIVYDATTDKMTFTGGAPPTAANPTGRVRVELTPRSGTEASAEAAAAAASAPPLRLSPALPIPTTPAPAASATKGPR